MEAGSGLAPGRAPLGAGVPCLVAVDGWAGRRGRISWRPLMAGWAAGVGQIAQRGRICSFAWSMAGLEEAWLRCGLGRCGGACGRVLVLCVAVRGECVDMCLGLWAFGIVVCEEL